MAWLALQTLHMQCTISEQVSQGSEEDYGTMEWKLNSNQEQVKLKVFTMIILF